MSINVYFLIKLQLKIKIFLSECKLNFNFISFSLYGRCLCLNLQCIFVIYPAILLIKNKYTIHNLYDYLQLTLYCLKIYLKEERKLHSSNETLIFEYLIIIILLLCCFQVVLFGKKYQQIFRHLVFFLQRIIFSY